MCTMQSVHRRIRGEYLCGCVDCTMLEKKLSEGDRKHCIIETTTLIILRIVVIVGNVVVLVVGVHTTRAAAAVSTH